MRNPKIISKILKTTKNTKKHQKTQKPKNNMKKKGIEKLFFLRTSVFAREKLFCLRFFVFFNYVFLEKRSQNSVHQENC